MSSSKAATGKPATAKKAARKSSAPKAAAKTARPPKVIRAAVPAPAAMASSGDNELGRRMTEMANLLEKALRADDPAAIPAEPLQQILAAAAKAYTAKREAGEQFHPVSRAGRLTPTDIMVTANGLLRSGNLQIFELGMWQSWTGD